jgi:Ca2+/H+ antiporter
MKTAKPCNLAWAATITVVGLVVSVALITLSFASGTSIVINGVPLDQKYQAHSPRAKR